MCPHRARALTHDHPEGLLINFSNLSMSGFILQLYIGNLFHDVNIFQVWHTYHCEKLRSSLNLTYLGLSLNLGWRHRHWVVYFCVLCGNAKHSELRKWNYVVAFNMRVGKRLRKDDVIHHLFKSAGITFLHCSNWCLKENSGTPFWNLQIKPFTTVEMSSSQKWKHWEKIAHSFHLSLSHRKYAQFVTGENVRSPTAHWGKQVIKFGRMPHELLHVNDLSKTPWLLMGR